MRIVQVLNLFLLTLVAGVFWGTWFSLSRSIASVTPRTFLEVGRTMTANLGGPMGVLMPAALLSAVPVIYWQFRRGATLAFVLASAGLLLFIVALVATLAVNVPLDRLIVQWTLESLPADWTSTRDRWQFYHSLRTFASLAGLLCFFASVVYERRPGQTVGTPHARARQSRS